MNAPCFPDTFQAEEKIAFLMVLLATAANPGPIGEPREILAMEFMIER